MNLQAALNRDHAGDLCLPKYTHIHDTWLHTRVRIEPWIIHVHGLIITKFTSVNEDRRSRKDTWLQGLSRFVKMSDPLGRQELWKKLSLGVIRN